MGLLMIQKDTASAMSLITTANLIMPYCTDIQDKQPRKLALLNRTTNKRVQIKTAGHAVLINIVRNDVTTDFQS